ncbi:MAG TPA: nitrite reductase small subunit NirD [Bacillales bacterium]|nr:nitrite reductase small subunit NirD [Bacillales bacterium]
MIQILTKVAAVKYSELAERVGYSITIDQNNIAIFKLSNGMVRAIENRSPHPKGGVLSEGLVSGDYVFCPVYDWRISLIDGKVQAPDEGQVRTFSVEVEDDIVYIII